MTKLQTFIQTIRGFILLIIFPTIIYSSELNILNLAKERNLYEKVEWKSLLHFKDGLNIKDKKFILSLDDFSLENEMKKTIQGFFYDEKYYKNINEHPQCRFPARFLFIKNELNLKDDTFPKINCFDFEIYKAKAPADKIFIVYASENVKNPSSMMGHTFLKFEGINDNGDKKQHSLSFYTTIETANIFKLFYENTISGMQGFFILRPYKETLNRYIDFEKRNVWEFELNLKEYQKELLSYHMWELKDIDLKYYFTKYNCSTILFFSLSLVNNHIYEDDKIWITPLDITKYLYKYDLKNSSKLIPTENWLNRMVEENFKDKEIDLENSTIDISKYKSPNNIPDERQISFSYKNIDKSDFAKISFLPASHLLSGDNREYFGESELKIGYLSLLANKEKLKIDEFTLYGMKSYLPYQKKAKDLSFEFEMSIKRDYDSKMDYSSNTKIIGGIGYDFKLSYDMDFYFLLNGGINYNKEDNLKVVINPKIGFIIYEIFNMKTIFDYEKLYFEKNRIYDRYSLKQNIFISKNKNIYFNFDKYKSYEDKTNFEVGFAMNF